jgi:hypothetical protein
MSHTDTPYPYHVVMAMPRFRDPAAPIAVILSTDGHYAKDMLMSNLPRFVQLGKLQMDDYLDALELWAVGDNNSKRVFKVTFDGDGNVDTDEG